MLKEKQVMDDSNTQDGSMISDATREAPLGLGEEEFSKVWVIESETAMEFETINGGDYVLTFTSEAAALEEDVLPGLSPSAREMPELKAALALDNQAAGCLYWAGIHFPEDGTRIPL